LNPIVQAYIEQIFSISTIATIVAHCSDVGLCRKLIFLNYPAVQTSLFKIRISKFRPPASQHTSLLLNTFLNTRHTFYLKIFSIFSNIFFQFLQIIRILLHFFLLLIPWVMVLGLN